MLHHYVEVGPKPKMAINACALVDFVPKDGSQYLMFLKSKDDGIYEAFNGQTDPAYSIEKLRRKLGSSQIEQLTKALSADEQKEKLQITESDFQARLDKTIEVHLTNIPFKEIIRSISESINIVVEPEVMEELRNKTFSITLHEGSFKEFIKRLCIKANVSFRIDQNTVIIIPKNSELGHN